MSIADDDVDMSSPPLSPPAFDHNEDQSTQQGVKKEIIQAGSGWEKPKERYEVLVNIRGKAGEEVFDSNEAEGSPRTYTIGSGLPCKGLDAAFKGMKKGEKAKVTVDAHEVFGPEGLPNKTVPPVAEVTYEVELIDWKKVEDLSKKKTGGILVKTIVEGPDWEQPKETDVVFLRYRGRVQNEDCYFVVDGISEGSEPARFTASQIIPKGLQTAVKGMKKGSKVVVTLDGEHAFGNEGIPDKCVPPGATVEYEVELADIHTVTDVSKDGGVICEILNKSSEWKKPKETSKCVISYTAAVFGNQPWAERQFEEVKNKEIVIGAKDSTITDGLERALEELVQGQSALVTVRPEYAYGDAGYLDKVKPGETVQYNVELHSFVEAPSQYSMSASEKKAYSEQVKEAGNSYFKAGASLRALRRYKAALEPFEYLDGIKDDVEKKSAQELKSACLLNLAACHEKLADWSQVVSKCNKVLELPFGHAKARFRRAKAFTQLGRLQEAREDVEKLLLQDPNDKAVLALAANIRKLQKVHDARAKQVFGKMFNKTESKPAPPPETAASA